MQYKIQNIIYSLGFLVISFLLMRLPSNFENHSLTINIFETACTSSIRSILCFFIYVIFSMIIYTIPINTNIVKKIVFVFIFTLLLSIFDETIDYINGFGFSLNSLIKNTSGMILGIILIFSQKKSCSIIENE